MRYSLDFDKYTQVLTIDGYDFKTPETLYKCGPYLENEYRYADGLTIELVLEVNREVDRITAHGPSGSLTLYSNSYASLKGIERVDISLDVSCDEQMRSWVSEYEVTKHISNSDYESLFQIARDFVSQNPDLFEPEEA